MTTETPNVWHIVQVQANCEHPVAEELICMGFTVFVPHYRKEYRHNRSKAWTTKFIPLMRGYLFVLASEHWGRIRECKQVVGVLRNKGMGGDGSPVALDDREIRAIREAQDAGVFDERPVHGGDVRAGDSVRIAEGALAGIRAVVEREGHDKLTVLLTMLGRQVKATAPLEMLLKTG